MLDNRDSFQVAYYRKTNLSVLFFIFCLLSVPIVKCHIIWSRSVDDLLFSKRDRATAAVRRGAMSAHRDHLG